MTNQKENPSHFQRATCWSALTGLSIFTIVALTAGLLFGLGALFVALEPVLLPVIIAGVLAYLLYPCVVRVQRRVRKRLLAVVLVLAGAAVVVAGLGAAIVPPLVEQTGLLFSKQNQILASAVTTGQNFINTNTLAQRAIDTLYDQTRRDDNTIADAKALFQKPAEDDYTAKALAVLDYHSESLTRAGVRWLTAGTRAIYGSLGMIIGLVMIPVFLFYFLLQGEIIERNWHTILPLRASKFRQEVVETLRQINDYIISFVRGQMLVSFIDGILLGFALKVMGLPYAITIGAAAALLGIIPYIGMISTSIPALLIAWVTWHDAGHVVAVLLIFFGVSQLDGWLLQPRVLGKRLHMHDLTIMFSVLFWSSVLGGIVGALLAVPLTAALKVIFIRYVWSTLHHAPQHAGELPEPETQS